MASSTGGLKRLSLFNNWRWNLLWDLCRYQYHAQIILYCVQPDRFKPAECTQTHRGCSSSHPTSSDIQKSRRWAGRFCITLWSNTGHTSWWCWWAKVTGSSEANMSIITSAQTSTSFNYKRIFFFMWIIHTHKHLFWTANWAWEFRTECKYDEVNLSKPLQTHVPTDHNGCAE